MKKWFICPDSEKIVIGDCLKKCRLGERCAPKSYLLEVSHERDWKGNGSCTQLLNGARQVYLQIKTDYAVNPAEKTLAIIGSRAHSKLEKNEIRDTFAEETLRHKDISSTFDILEFEDGEDEGTLIDTKTVGAYKLAKSLGVVKTKIEEPILGEDGQPVLLKSGKNKGQPKTASRTEISIDPAKADIQDYIYQLNWNRLAIEKELGYKVKAMKVFLVCRESDMTKKIHGVDGISTRMINIPYMTDNEIEDFYVARNSELKKFITDNKIPPVCSASECWDGIKCQRFCDVREMCRMIGDNQYLQGSDNE